MTDVIFPPNTTLLLEALEINGGLGAPTTLEDGELYIDEVNRLIYTKSEDGIEGTPLDVQGMPPNRGVITSYVLIKTDEGGEWQQLTAGGGGASQDSETWRIPGLAPLAVGSMVFPGASGGHSIFHLGKPKALKTLRVRALAGNGNLTLTINAYNGSVGTQLFTRTFAISAAGVYTYALNLPMAIGDYALTYTSASGLTIETIEGYMPWTTARQAYPVSMEFA